MKIRKKIKSRKMKIRREKCKSGRNNGQIKMKIRKTMRTNESKKKKNQEENMRDKNENVENKSRRKQKSGRR